MLATVVIANYNYGRFLRDAVDSALAQTHADTEVVVVDDGSTDDSREILEEYGDRVRAIVQDNAGQRAAINRAVTHARGDIICLLDSDDTFVPEKVSRVVDGFSRDPKPSLVYHQLQAVSADGRQRIGRPMPRAVLEGDIRHRVERAGGWWPRPTTSALSFARPFLEHLLPIPPRRDGFLAPDTYLAGAAPFYGPVVGLAVPLARLRLHDANRWTRTSIEGSSGSELFRLRRDQYVRDVEALQTGLRERLGIDPRFSLDDHFRYQQYRRGAGEPVSLAKVVTMALGCPTLPWSMRWREAVKISLGRW